MESTVPASCFDCTLRPDRLFCDLPADVLQAFDAIKSASEARRGTTLFHEGRPGRAVFVLCQGRVRLSVCSESEKRLTLRIAGPGEMLGLSACLSGSPYEITAEALDDVRVAVIRRKDWIEFLQNHREACLQVVNLLSDDLHTAYDRVRSVGLGRSRRTPTAPRVH